MVFRLRATLWSIFGFFCLSLFSSPTFSQEISAAWEWHTVSGAHCRNGSEAGYYLRRNSFDSRLLIFMEGGGACFNSLSCSQNPAGVGNQYPGKQGIFADRDDNPLRAWNTMYLPYCTGDVFSGSRTGVNVAGVSGQQDFMGYQNFQKFMQQVQASLPEPEMIVLSGVSAGGFGAIFNYPSVRDRWPEVPVVLLDDSGVPLEDAYLKPCLQKTFRELWGVDAVLPEDCSYCRSEDGGGLFEMTRYIREKYGDTQQGMVLSSQDQILRLFFGFSQNNCQVLIPNMSAQFYEKGIVSLKSKYLKDSIKTFIVPGTEHTFISSNRFYQTTLDGQSLASWVSDLLLQKAVDRGLK